MPPFSDEISGLAIIKLLDKSTQSAIMLKVKFTRNAAMLDNIYAICKHSKLRALVTSLAFQQAKEVNVEEISDENYKCKCTAQFYIILALSIVIKGLVVFTILQVRRIKLCRGQLFSNVVKIMLFISDIQYHVPVKLCRMAGSIHLFTGRLTADKVKLSKHYVWDILEIDWSEDKVTFNGKVINLPKSITDKLWDKFKVRHMMESQPILFHLMSKQGFNWFTLTPKEQETKNVLQDNLILQKNGKRSQSGVQLFFQLCLHKSTFTHS